MVNANHFNGSSVVKHRKLSIRCLVIVTLLIGGCASRVPQDIEQKPEMDLTVRQVQQRTQAYIDKRVRWGGEIIRVENRPRITEVEILARELSSGGKPITGGELDARFMGHFEGFLDPADYKPGQRVTVTGRVTGSVTGQVGEYAYSYPVVHVESYYRWPKETPAPDPWRYHYPYYDPWWPYAPWYRHPYWW